MTAMNRLQNLHSDTSMMIMGFSCFFEQANISESTFCENSRKAPKVQEIPPKLKDTSQNKNPNLSRKQKETKLNLKC